MKKIYIYILCAVLSVGVFSCDDFKFLEEKPETFYTIDNTFSSTAQVDQVLISCYSQVRYMLISESNTFYAYRGGNGTDMYDVPTIRRSSRFNDYGILNPMNRIYYDIYTYWYQLISKANLAIYAAELPIMKWPSETEKAYTLAQARFFRAFCYRNLGELFGGVPIVTEIITTPRYDFVRASRIKTYQFAINELEAILTDLPEKSPIPGRLVRGVAQHTLCQLYLDLGIAQEEEGLDGSASYEKSITYGDSLIDGSIYSLMTERFGSRKNDNPDFFYANIVSEQIPEHLYSAAGYKIEGNVIWDLFQEGNQNYQDGNKEAIWVAQVDYDAYKTEDKQAKLPYARVFGPTTRDPHSNIIKGMLEDLGGRGVCFVMPTMYTRDSIYEGKWNNDLRNSEAVFRRIFLGNVKESEYYGKLIPWSVFYKEGQSKDAIDAAMTQTFPVSCKISTDKYRGVNEGENRSNLFRDDYLIRLPETILLRAEAKMRIGDKAGAANDINLLRKRAQCEYLVQASDINLDLILDERARELIYEETRWNTLLRMGGTVAVDRIKKYSYWDDPRKTIKKNFNLWPIPQVVIDTNKDVKMEQNPGWE